MAYYVYMMASKPNGTLYTGVTNNLVRRAFEHKTSSGQGFTSRYRCNRLVWYEIHQQIEDAIQREKNIKHYVRAWKINLINEMNPKWQDLYETLNA